MKKILFILGTARKDRVSEKVANFVLETAKERSDIEPIFVDVKDYPQTHTGGLDKELTEKYNGIIRDASGIIIISPEYNHGYPGELKLLLDSAYDAYRGKSVSICGVSSGPIGGARMVEQLKLVLSAFQLTIVNSAVYFSNISDSFMETKDETNKKQWKDRVNGMLNDVLNYSSKT